MLVVEECTAEEALAHMTWDSAIAKEAQAHALHSEIFLRVRRGQVALAVFGACRVSLLSDTGYCWVWTASAIDHHRYGFARASRQVSGLLFTRFRVLVGYCFARSSVRWLTWLGVTFGPEDEVGFPFRMERLDG